MLNLFSSSCELILVTEASLAYFLYIAFLLCKYVSFQLQLTILILIKLSFGTRLADFIVNCDMLQERYNHKRETKYHKVIVWFDYIGNCEMVEQITEWLKMKLKTLAR